MFSMTLKKIAKKITPQHTYFAYARVDKGKVKYFWRNPYNDELLPIRVQALKNWELVVN